MSAVIRIKRHLSEEPQKAFLLNYKKRKTDDATMTPETSTVLTFAGTVNQESSNINEQIAKFQLTKDEAKEIVTRKRPETNLKNRLDQNREKSQQNRFKIVNCSRALNDDEAAESQPAAPAMTIVDVEKDRTPTAQTSSYSDISDEPFVYDIYVAESAAALQNPESFDLNDLSILEYNDYLYSRPRLVNSDSEEDDEEDEDSNDENNWRNDYPDEEMSDESIGEKDMRQAMNNFEIGNELSSDEEDQNGFVYSVDSEAFSFEDDLDCCDVNRYGEAYARYKKRVTKELEDDDDDDEEDESDDEHESCENSFHSD